MITRDDFNLEGPHQWVLNKNGYRIVVRRVDNAVEVMIRAELSSDPTEDDWVDALVTVNSFYQKLRLGEKYEQ